jgi:hypothetical protein
MTVAVRDLDIANDWCCNCRNLEPCVKVFFNQSLCFDCLFSIAGELKMNNFIGAQREWELHRLMRLYKPEEYYCSQHWQAVL